MKKMLCSIFVIFLLWFAIDRVGGALMHWVTWHTHERFSQKICKIVSNVDADILLLGNSRCESHYMPSVICDSTGMSVYNAGISKSASIYFQYVTLAHILRYHTPKVVVLDTGESEFADIDENLSLLTYYAPHIGLCAEADSVFEWLDMLGRYRFSHLYRYHSLSNVALARLFMPEDAHLEDGYMPIACPPLFPSDRGDVQMPLPCVERKITVFRRFIQLCRRHHIQLILSISPSYSLIDEHYYDVLKAIAAEEQLPLLDYDTPGIYNDQPELFYDNAHLWEKGSRIFSERFAHDLKDIIVNQKTPSGM